MRWIFQRSDKAEKEEREKIVLKLFALIKNLKKQINLGKNKAITKKREKLGKDFYVTINLRPPNINKEH